jgi:hypothetical protein
MTTLSGRQRNAAGMAPLAARALRCPAFREVGTSDHGPVLAEFESA